jgi:inner membrane protease ATP23
MNDTLTHELVHTLDYCRAEIDWDNLDHLACTEVRAANLSGECFFSKETFTRMKFGWKKHQQVRERGRERGREREASLDDETCYHFTRCACAREQ